ncbi:conserved hypothetical protein [Leishmania mexicana MHOM/GT/2001/U1103]|uniref:Uncharacterized protein n=1 Tax=Leishmania mexicana (strain MHOM/GT/2001/U1103) TaxID=929439 RepID=E9B498_LEIMU|nr:conserved hypothetical protein [Leishmania mexicana MHOM/GT/2001/U1103]CBZ30066.1 conserved hypothetical protein [Leishmania mexicana MHOM/GT/2001/U1103]
MRCSASFLFSGAPPAAGSASGQRQHALRPPPPPPTGHLDREGQTSLDDRRMSPPALRPRSHSSSWRSRAPRPVTARQLCRAILGMDHVGVCAAAVGRHCSPHATQEPQTCVLPSASTSIASAPCGEGHEVRGHRHGLPEAVRAARLGESTIQLDAAACHRVVVCGRIVRCIDAFSNGSVAAAARAVASSVSPIVIPYDLLWLSDTTGVVCVLRLRPALVHRRAPLPSTSCLGGGWTNVPARDGRCDPLGAAGVGLSHPFAAVDAGGTTPLLMSAAARASLPDRNSCSPVREERQCPNDLGSGEVTHKGIGLGTEATVAMVNLGLEYKNDYVLSMNDYVVCVGSLAFADVDVQTRHALESYASDLRQATWAAATSSRSSFSPFSGDAASFIGTGDASGDAGCPACGADGRDPDIDEDGAAVSLEHRSAPAPPPRQAFVLLPGSEVPLTLDAARAQLGVVGSLPSSTHYLTAAEAAQWGCTHFDHAAPSSTLSSFSASELRDHSDGRKLATSAGWVTSTAPPCAGADMNAVPLMGIKGHPRLVLDTNECLFWWLAAAETHLRLRARASAPLA